MIVNQIEGVVDLYTTVQNDHVQASKLSKTYL